MGKPFVNLHSHSHYSLLEAVSSPKKILAHAKSLGCPAVALTDKGNGHGLVEFREMAQKEEIQSILGAEIALSFDSRFEKRPGIDGEEGHLVFLAQNPTGYTHLVRLLSQASMEGLYMQPRIDFELLEKHKEGLICLTGSVKGILAKALEDYGKNRALEILEKLHNLFGDRLYLEFVALEGEEARNLNLFLQEYVLENDFKNVVITSDSRYLTPDQEEAADVLYCVGRNIKVNGGRDRFAPSQWFKTFEEMVQTVPYLKSDILEQARQNTLALAESCEEPFEFHQNLLPDVESQKGMTTREMLLEHCEKGLKIRYPDLKPEQEKIFRERLNYELSIIGKMGFEAYFLIVEDFIRFAKDNDIAVGPGRGSAAGSFVSYLLEITNIDPIEYDLLFERFLNPERISMPDVDIDFSDERREEVTTYVIEKYGAEKVSRVCTFGTLSAKAALKDVGRVLGVNFSEMNAMTKLIPAKPGFKLKDGEDIKEFKSLIQANPLLQKVYTLALALEGCVRHVSVHACAVIIGKDDLSQYTPVQWAPGSDTVKITQYPYQQLEHIGLLKMDFLGLKNLSVLERTIKNIKITTGTDLVMDDISLKDEKTFAMLSRGETTGVFQFESAGMRRYLKQLKPTDLEDLVAMNALYRPGPMEYIPTYIQGKHDPSTVQYMDPILEPILSKTYGIAVYQEQVLRIAQVMGGFSLGEADILRKAIGKKIASILQEQRTKFIEGAIKKGFKQSLAEKIFDEIVVPFSGYGFNRSHAVCYARIAYETAYLRANYPVEFMTAMMTTDRNNTDRIVLEMNECASMGIQVLPPDINQSGSHFTIIKRKPVDTNQLSVEGVEVLEKEKQHSQSIRFGLTAIKGLGEETVNQIILERKSGGKFESLQDFAKRVPAKLMNKKTLEALAYSGAFDMFGDRGAIVASLDDLASFAKEHQEKSSAGQIGLFGGMDEEAISFTLKNTKATKEDILAWERESMGLFVSDHPLKGLHEELEKKGTLIGSLMEEDAGDKKTFHGIITSVRKLVTRKGLNMAILQIEDTSGNIEVALFPQIYDSVDTDRLNTDTFVRVRGKVNEREGVLNIIADEIKNLSLQNFVQGSMGGMENAQKEIAKPVIEIKIPSGTTKAQIIELKQLLKQKESPIGDALSFVLEGKKVPIPFLVQWEDALELAVADILRK